MTRAYSQSNLLVSSLKQPIHVIFIIFKNPSFFKESAWIYIYNDWAIVFLNYLECIFSMFSIKPQDCSASNINSYLLLRDKVSILFLYLIFIASVLYLDISKNKIRKMELSLLIIKKFDYMNSNTILQRETILFLQGHYI